MMDLPTQTDDTRIYEPTTHSSQKTLLWLKVNEEQQKNEDRHQIRIPLKKNEKGRKNITKVGKTRTPNDTDINHLIKSEAQRHHIQWNY